jgi:hypothetical protein
MAQVVGHLPSKYEALNSQYHLEREREREREREGCPGWPGTVTFQ